MTKINKNPSKQHSFVFTVELLKYIVIYVPFIANYAVMTSLIVEGR